MLKIFRQPIVHIVALGALAWIVYILAFGGQESSGYVITVTEGDVEQLMARFQLMFKRAPTKEELTKMIENNIREEIFYREAILLGLDEEDMIIRRRLAQKMDFLSSDLASLAEPSEQAIVEYYESKLEDYREPPFVTFSHIYFNVDRRGVLEARDEAVRVREKLNGPGGKDTDPQEYGDPFVLQYHYPEYSPFDVEKTFGEREFSVSLFTFEPGAWQGPVVSSYGLHLVYVHSIIESRMPGLEEVREDVLNDLRSDIRQQANDIFYAGLRSNYEIRIDEEIRDRYDFDSWQRDGDDR